MSELDVKLAGKSLADFTNTQLRLALGAVLYTNTADMWKRYLNQLGYSGDVSQMLQKYYVEYSVPQNFRNYINAGAFIYSPQQLFTDGSKGVVYDNNDFVDSATWRRNLLTYSEQFDNAAWGKLGTAPTVTQNFTADPLGATTADRIVYGASGIANRVSQSLGSALGAIPITLSIWLRGDVGGETIQVSDGWTNSSDFVLTTSWQRFTASITGSASSTAFMLFAKTGTPTIYAWGAQLERASSASDYQRITDFNTEFLAAFPSTTLFLDSAGTTPATVNGLVGLQLDKSAGLVLGAELVTNGDFSGGTTGWTGVNCTLSNVSGVCQITADGVGQARASQSIATVIGRWYEARAQIWLGTGATGMDLLIPGIAQSVSVFSTTPTDVVVRFIATATSTTVRAGTTASTLAGGTYFVDNISVKELPGNHRYQTTTGSKPVLRGTPTGASLVTNGDFASGTGWTTGAGWSIGSGVATSTGSLNSALDTPFATTNGKTYLVTYTVSGYTAGQVRVRFTGTANVSGILRGANGTYVEYITATSDNNTLRFVDAGSGFSGSIDNVTIFDVSAGSVTAPYGLQYDGVDDFLQTAAVDFATVTSDGLARRNLASNPKALDTYATLLTPIVTANAAAAPDGSMTATQIEVGAGQTAFALRNAGPTSLVGNQANSIYFKLVGSTTGTLGVLRSDRDPSYCGVNVATRAPLTANAAGVSNSSVTIETLPDGWYRLKGAYTSDISTETRIQLTNSTAGDKILLWGVQTEQGTLTVTDFQNIGTDKMFVCAGVRKLVDTSFSILVEISASLDLNNGAFYIAAPTGSAANNYRVASKGTTANTANTSASFAGPVTSVVTASGNISGPTVSVNVNGGTPVTASGSQGTGNYGNYAIYFGRRGGTANPYNGLDFGFVIVGKTLTSNQISQTERYIAQRTGIAL